MKKTLVLLLTTSFSIATLGQIIHIPQDHKAFQDGIEAASSGDTILVDVGTYMENIRIEGKKLIIGSKFLTTGDTSYISKTIINGFEHGPVVKFAADVPDGCELKGFTITNGNGEDELGGGILIRGSAPCLEHLIITSNKTAQGGGIACVDQGTLNLAHSKICNNTTTQRGGGIFSLNSSLNLLDCKISNNEAAGGLGAAIYFGIGGGLAIMPDIHIDSTCIENNKSTGNGVTAGAYFEKPNELPVMIINVENTVFKSNFSNSSSALRIHGQKIEFNLTNCSFISNEALQYTGGATFSNGCTGEIVNCLFAFNRAATGGGEYNSGALTIWNGAEVDFYNCSFVDNSASYGSVLTLGAATGSLTNCISWSNSNDHIALRDFNQTGSTISVDYCDIENGQNSISQMLLSSLIWKEGNINEDPLFAGTGDNPYALLAGSPCIDNGSPETATLPLPSYDYLGNKRVWDGDGDQTIVIDIGPYEFGSIPAGIKVPEKKSKTKIPFHVYPNPAEDRLIIETEICGQYSLEISTLGGQLIYIEKIDKCSQQINLSPFQKGIYFITIRSKDIVTTRKIIKL